jgi:hypothetical protein
MRDLFPEDRDVRFMANIGVYVADYTVLRATRPQLPHLPLLELYTGDQKVSLR